MAVPDVLMAGREPPRMGPVAHGFATLGDAAERAVSQLAAVLDDVVQAPSRLSRAAALLTNWRRSSWHALAGDGAIWLPSPGRHNRRARGTSPVEGAAASAHGLAAIERRTIAVGLLRALAVDIADHSMFGQNSRSTSGGSKSRARNMVALGKPFTSILRVV